MAARVPHPAPAVPGRLLGLDPGTLRMGYGLLDTSGPSAVFVTCGVLKASPRASIEARLLVLHRGLEALLKHWRPCAMAIEEPFVPRSVPGEDGYRTSARSAIAVGQAQAIALLAAAAQGLMVYRYAPAQVKRAVTAHGGSSKEQVQEMARLLLGLASRPEPADAADALAVALCHVQAQRTEGLLKAGES